MISASWLMICLSTTCTANFMNMITQEQKRFMEHQDRAAKCTEGKLPPSVQSEVDEMMISVRKRYDVSFFPFPFSFSVRLSTLGYYTCHLAVLQRISQSWMISIFPSGKPLFSFDKGHCCVLD